MLDKGTATSGGAAGDGLIDPGAFVVKSAGLDTGEITGSATAMRSMGGAVRAGVDGVEASWSALTGCYEAPEQGRVYALMEPAAADADGLNFVLRTAADHLVP